MNNPYRLLPPLSTLIGFEAAARLGSFSAAAEELNMTQSAISHQIRTLEEHLQQPLFLRINRRVELTDAGRDLEQTAADALEMVRVGVRRLESYSKPNSAILHMPPEIGSLWFLPRLEAFRLSHPNIDPWLYTADGEVDLSEAEIDISLTQSPDQHGEAIKQVFFHDRVIPMASPDIAARFRDRMDTAPLLHDESSQDWRKWFNDAGIVREEYVSGPNFSDRALMLEAAANGIGVCLGSIVLAGPMISSGRLEIISDLYLEVENPYYLITLDRNLKREGVRKLWDWLLENSS